MIYSSSWYAKNISEIFKILDSRETGLTKIEAEQRLKKYGKNRLPEGKTDSLVTIFFHQFKSPLIYILLVASIVVIVMGEIIDGSIILIVLLFNAIIGTFQEGKAQNTLFALKKSLNTRAVVLRGEQEYLVSDEEVVPGDIVFLREGERVPADARIISSIYLQTDEAALTGESKPVEKETETIKEIGLSISEQKNMIFKGTYVLAGSGKAIVTEVGFETAIGKIYKEAAAIDTEIPLKKNIRDLSKLIIVTVGIINLLLFILGVISGISFKEMFITVVSLSVSIIPEGLPIVMTLVLATGVWRMSKRNVLIKKLHAVEALGQASIIAVDKTGTITKNEMVIKKVYTGGKMFEIGGVGYEPKGEFFLNEKRIEIANFPDLLLLGRMAGFCVNARVIFSEEEKIWRVVGDPTEAALLVLAEKMGFRKEEQTISQNNNSEMPFDYKLKYGAVIRLIDRQKVLIVTGAPETILNLSQKIYEEEKIQQLSEEKKQELYYIFLSMSQEGLRIIALAEALEIPAELKSGIIIPPLIFRGFFGMKDALREEITAAVQKSISAGIRVVMITGDHKITAQSIAREAGIYQEGDTILTGQELDSLSDEKLRDNLNKISVFARVTPDHKYRIIKAFKSRGEIVAMTGDGVNDGPSLVAADLGVSMGKIGTEVAKEASDIVLLDDNFGSIVSAVEEGRNIYKTIKKVVLYLFSTSVGEAITIAGALLLGYPLPLLPAQIIWLNFVTDGFLDMALAMEQKEKGLLRGNYEKPTKRIIDNLMVKRIFTMAIPMMIGTLFLFKDYYKVDIVKAWTISLTTLAVFQWFNVWNCRHESKSIFQINFFSNKYLIGAMLIVISLQILVIYNPIFQRFMRTSPLNLTEWFIIIPIASSVIIVEEIRKFFL